MEIKVYSRWGSKNIYEHLEALKPRSKQVQKTGRFRDFVAFILLLL